MGARMGGQTVDWQLVIWCGVDGWVWVCVCVAVGGRSSRKGVRYRWTVHGCAVCCCGSGSVYMTFHIALRCRTAAVLDQGHRYRQRVCAGWRHGGWQYRRRLGTCDGAAVRQRAQVLVVLGWVVHDGLGSGEVPRWYSGAVVAVQLCWGATEALLPFIASWVPIPCLDIPVLCCPQCE